MSSTGDTSDVVVKKISSTRVLGLRTTVLALHEQKALWDTINRLWQSCGEKAEPAGPRFAVHYSMGQNGSPIDVEVCIPLKQDTPLPLELGQMTVHTMYEVPRAATVSFIGPNTRIAEAYEVLFAWLETTGETIAGPTREIYLRMGNEDMGSENNETEVQVELL